MNHDPNIGPTQEELNEILQQTPKEEGGTWSAEDLIRYAEEHPVEPIIDGLLNVGETLLLHGTEENFKSFFVLQVAESICTARPLLRGWVVPSKRRVGVVETEMHPAGLGERLGKMFADGGISSEMLFLSQAAIEHWRGLNLRGKFEMLEAWIANHDIEVLIVDTANDFFRGRDNPLDERVVGGFFDRMRKLHLQARILVRHDRKKKEHDGGAHSNELIRGSARWKEDPETILYLKRKDKRTHEVHMEVGKLRYGKKPEPQDLWFDAKCFRLTPLPPVIAVLENGGKSREELVSECQQRFGVGGRKVSDMLDEEGDFIVRGQEGHKKTLEIDPERAKEAPWHPFLGCHSESHPPMYIEGGPHIAGGEAMAVAAPASPPEAAE